LYLISTVDHAIEGQLNNLMMFKQQKTTMSKICSI
jgi:hypothetical protein